MGSWNPWRDLRGRGRTVELRFDAVTGRCGGAVWERHDDRDVITIDPGLGRRQRSAALGHELVHVDRGIGHPVAPPALMQREEATVRRIVANRMVPEAALAEFVRSRADVEPVTAVLVAEEFDVAVHVARLALELLAMRWAS